MFFIFDTVSIRFTALFICYLIIRVVSMKFNTYRRPPPATLESYDWCNFGRFWCPVFLSVLSITLSSLSLSRAWAVPGRGFSYSERPYRGGRWCTGLVVLHSMVMGTLVWSIGTREVV